MCKNFSSNYELFPTTATQHLSKNLLINTTYTLHKSKSLPKLRMTNNMLIYFLADIFFGNRILSTFGTTHGRNKLACHLLCNLAYY